MSAKQPSLTPCCAVPKSGRMETFFMFGSLMDIDILSAVLGRDVPTGTLKAARAMDFKRLRISGVSYPALVAHPGSVADGVLVDELTPRDVARLADYEGANYDVASLRAIRLDGRNVDAKYWRWIGKRKLVDEPWDFDEWRRTAKSKMLGAAKAVGRAT